MAGPGDQVFTLVDGTVVCVCLPSRSSFVPWWLRAIAEISRFADEKVGGVKRGD